MKNIVVLGGSPRKNGNTDMLAQAFIKGALEVGNSVEYISVRDVKVNPCVGCNTFFYVRIIHVANTMTWTQFIGN